VRKCMQNLLGLLLYNNSPKYPKMNSFCLYYRWQNDILYIQILPVLFLFSASLCVDIWNYCYFLFVSKNEWKDVSLADIIDVLVILAPYLSVKPLPIVRPMSREPEPQKKKPKLDLSTDSTSGECSSLRYTNLAESV